MSASKTWMRWVVTRATFFSLLSGFVVSAMAADAPACYVPKPTWTETMLASRAALKTAALPAKERKDAQAAVGERVERDFPIQWDWALQDGGLDFPNWFAEGNNTNIEQKMIAGALEELGDGSAAGRGKLDALTRNHAPPDDPRWLDLYARVCEQRRAIRLKTVLAQSPKIVFTKHQTIRPSFFAYTEGQSDAQAERHFHPGSSLCLLEMDGTRGRVRVLLNDPTGAIRDPAVSYDGRRVMFAWKKSLNDDDYHLYEMDVASGRIRQITSGLGFADYEPSYLPNGDIIFSSTRCVQTVDCFTTEVSNLYTCDKDGRCLRRLGFDQVHTIYPTVTDDGRVIYTRWDYNDRGQIFPQALFQMNPDGTAQTALYGNNSWFPTTITHARGIPGSHKIVCIFCGHHTPQTGKLGLIDPSKGREENSGAQLIAPARESGAEHTDAYGQQGELFQYPYPLNETEFLVTYAPLGRDFEKEKHSRLRDTVAARFGIYYMRLDGRRELLVSDPDLPCNQPFPLAPRPTPPPRPNKVDYRQATGTYYMQDVYAGAGLEGVPRGTIQKLRVVALDFRAALMGNNGSSGPGGGAMISTPIAIGNGAWDVKIVLGDAKVHADGSAFFTVPARTPVYFQALDAQGRAVQTMRSWSTLQPGENQSCVGCHENKNAAPPMERYHATAAFKNGPQALEPFYGPPRGFSFAREIQPILDRKCVSCHNDREAAARLYSTDPRKPRAVPAPADPKKVFSLLGAEVPDPTAKRKWNDAYLVLTQAYPNERRKKNPAAECGCERFSGWFEGRLVNWAGSQSVVSMLPPYFAGSTKSELVAMLERGHRGVTLTREEMEKLCAWIDLFVPFCGDYKEANAWNEQELARYDHYDEKRRHMEAVERANIAEFIARSEKQPLTGAVAK
jgi:Hydrazine synthase alpha subunit middle domain